MDAIGTAGKRCRNRPPKVRLSWAAQVAMLEAPETIRAMPAHERRNRLSQLAALRRRMEGTCCTVVWFEDFWSQGANYPIQGEPAHFHKEHVEYPPRADTTPMTPCRCRECSIRKRLWPAGYVRTAGLSYECFAERQPSHITAHWPSSPGSIIGRWQI